MQFNPSIPNTWTANFDTAVEQKKAVPATKPVPEKTKRKQVKNACVNCQKACKKCDDGRPCKRCIKLGLTATCRDSDRKERKKGVKRGPYKKRQAYIKDKPVYPKLTEEQSSWKTPIYENVPQVLSHAKMPSHPLTISTMVSPVYTPPFFDEEVPCVPSQGSGLQLLSSLSPTSASSFDELSDETLHYAYGGYTNNMLDHHHQTISGNVTPLQDEFYSWDDISTLASPIGSTPISSFNQFPMNYQKEMTTHLFDFNMPAATWVDNDFSSHPIPSQSQQLYQPWSF
ncbi:uncharacterized protein B0P05DRAFT_555182 [Gilbertella persicaria]|uniref:uncharacterized protein n=1 Tax=Gilbertella persicaria TaxID=101096 RepID=UPI00221EA919|nr:uncharacterized protein B0P05DRAFT_555182 [Gilbertella persicaria]KAI8063655.1 hypothetical protein B0P05DRAFT_555182 [Gilbertella persicaria]